MEMTNNKVINRIYSVLIVLFFATPFLFIFYGQILQRMGGIDFQELLSSTPSLNVTFITSFITPFMGLYMLHLKQEFEKGLNKEVVLSNLIAITVSFLIMGNVTYGLFVSILIYFLYFEWKVGIKRVYDYYKNSPFNIKDWLAPIAVLIIGIVIRLMLVIVSNS